MLRPLQPFHYVNAPILRFAICTSSSITPTTRLQPGNERKRNFVQKILAAGQVDPISVIDQNGKSLLHLAAARGSLELVSLLLSGEWLQCETIEPLNIDARNMQGRTALLEATFYGWVQVASFLLDFGACTKIALCLQTKALCHNLRKIVVLPPALSGLDSFPYMGVLLGRNRQVDLQNLPTVLATSTKFHPSRETSLRYGTRLNKSNSQKDYFLSPVQQQNR